MVDQATWAGGHDDHYQHCITKLFADSIQAKEEKAIKNKTSEPALVQ